MSTTLTFTTAESIAGDGVDWTDPQQAIGDDGTYAIASLSAVAPTTDPLRITNASTSAADIPDDATILGVEVVVQARRAGIGQVKIESVQLVKDGATLGDLDDTDSTIGTADDTYTYGSSTSLWGAELTAADIKDTAFGAQIICAHISSNVAAWIDDVTMVVYWASASNGVGAVIRSRSRLRRGF